MSTIWSFDLGKASIGEAVRYVGTQPGEPQNHEFLHKDSLLIPAEFASTRQAASRRRMHRSRQAHKARQSWLEQIWVAAGLTPLIGRRVEKREGKWRPAPENAAERERRKLLEREFPSKGDLTCYNSALLRIKLLDSATLLPGEALTEWQIYKALHSAIQKRGYGRVPWAAREARRGEKSEEEIVAGLLKKDFSKLTDDEKVYRAAVEAWPKFKHGVSDAAFHFPCYYDARAMGLWSPETPHSVRERIDCRAGSTRRVRFDREDVEKEIAALANRAADLLPPLRDALIRWKREGCTVHWHENPPRPIIHFGKENSSKIARAFDVKAKDFGELLVHGPAGKPPAGARDDFASYLAFRHQNGLHPGSNDDWMAAAGQKTPRFDNRIINGCALISRLQVCGVGVRFDKQTGRPTADSLLASEATFLMKLKNTLVGGSDGQRKLTPEEIRSIFAALSAQANAVSAEAKDADKKVIQRYNLTKTDWARTAGIKELELRPLKGHEEIKPPKTEGRSRFSRPALRLIRSLILDGDNPSVFLARLKGREPELLADIGMDVLDVAPMVCKGAERTYVKQPRPWVLLSDLKFLADLAATNDSWKELHFPEQRLDALEARHTDSSGKVNSSTAELELLGSINDPIVRHRLGVFAGRLAVLERQYGKPSEVVLEFVREDFMGEEAKRELSKFQSQREKERKVAAERAVELGVTERSGRLKYELFQAQSGICLYCQQAMFDCALADYRIEHIVPRAQGGADAAVNYVLAHEACNDAKGDRTPYQWLQGREGWDGYVTCVQAHATALRNKKVQLLLREDAAELIQRYTALAETAWISRLAQKIVSLHFGWRNGNDKEGVKRVTVLSGGFTARIRRRYRLNSLLNPMKPEWFNLQREKAREGKTLTPEQEARLNETIQREWEALAEKNRADDRHHALDAMVINFWNTGTKKQDAHFFRFPDKVQTNPRTFFERHIAQVMARTVAYEKAQLAETIYGGRSENGRTMIVQRRPLLGLGLRSNAGKMVFDERYLRKQINNLREPRVAEALLRFLDDFGGSESIEAEWHRFCIDFRLFQRDGTPGPRVIKVTVNCEFSDEYIELSKDQTGAYRKGKQSHKGQIVFKAKFLKNGTLRDGILVRPVYAFESRPTVESDLKKEHSEGIRIVGYYKSGCLISIDREVATGARTLPPGIYQLNTIRADRQVRVTTREGHSYPDIPYFHLEKLVAAGMKRAD